MLWNKICIPVCGIGLPFPKKSLLRNNPFWGITAVERYSNTMVCWLHLFPCCIHQNCGITFWGIVFIPKKAYHWLTFSWRSFNCERAWLRESLSLRVDDKFVWLACDFCGGVLTVWPPWRHDYLFPWLIAAFGVIFHLGDFLKSWDLVGRGWCCWERKGEGFIIGRCD